MKIETREVVEVTITMPEDDAAKLAALLQNAVRWEGPVGDTAQALYHKLHAAGYSGIDDSELVDQAVACQWP